MTSTALDRATDAGTVEESLRGYHREWYVVRPRQKVPGVPRLKVGAPRDNALWFDRRCFVSEDDLLRELASRAIPRIPTVHRLASGSDSHRFVEGTSLDTLHPAEGPVPLAYLNQIMEVFGRLAAVRPGELLTSRLCSPEERPREGDSAGFLAGLLRFTRKQGYRRHIPRYGRLFRHLGLPRDALGPRSALASEAAQLTGRPFCLLHGDLHRANLIVDASGMVWTVDWELAMLGDPLYDLATHLHLTHYPPEQEREVIRRWRATLSGALPGATTGMDEDLPRYLAYKRAQSVYTDVVRHASALRDIRSPTQRNEQLRDSAKTVHRIIRRAADALELRDVPGPGEVEAAYRTFGAVRPVRAQR